MLDLLITNGTVVTAGATFQADIGVIGDRFEAILAPGSEPPAHRTLDASGCYVIPGAIDAHVHLHMATGVGYTADDWCTGTTAAALGGVTALVDFVETTPQEPLLEALSRRLEETREAVIDFGLHMTLQPDEDPHPQTGVMRRVSEQRIAQITQAYAAGCATFKIYMAYPGYRVRDGDLFRALRAIHEVNGLACIHAENGEVIDVLRAAVSDPRSALLHARTRPSINEFEAVTRAVMCAELSGARMLIFHIGCEHAAQAVAQARQRGLASVFGETCPQYLVLTEDMLARSDGRRWVCAPPLRPHADQDVMWRMLATQVLDIVSTDHCPFTLAQKEAGKDDFRLAPGGVPGIETRLGLMHELGVRRGRLRLNDWVRICCTRPAELHGFNHKGHIAPGYDADLVIFDPQAQKHLTASELHSAIDWSAYEAITCTGWPRDVIARGEVIVRAQHFCGQKACGRFVQRAFQLLEHQI
jgi:dihydropyrimidinase